MTALHKFGFIHPGQPWDSPFGLILPCSSRESSSYFYAHGVPGSVSRL